jgi:hypothetical protein
MRGNTIAALAVPLSCVAFGVALGASLFPVLMDDPTKWIGQGGRSEWLAFWGAIIGALATIAAGGMAWLAVWQQIQANQALKDAEEARYLEEIISYLSKIKHVFYRKDDILQKFDNPNITINELMFEMHCLSVYLTNFSAPEDILDDVGLVPPQIADQLKLCVRRYRDFIKIIPEDDFSNYANNSSKILACLLSLDKGAFCGSMISAQLAIEGTREVVERYAAERGVSVSPFSRR